MYAKRLKRQPLIDVEFWVNKSGRFNFPTLEEFDQVAHVHFTSYLWAGDRHALLLSYRLVRYVS